MAVSHQGATIHMATSGIHSYSGFIATFVFNPELDGDNDGIADENDRDDDNDGITDGEELDGTAFTPQTWTDPLRADSDGDGMMDGMESEAGTNPRDPASLLQILSCSLNGGFLSICWLAREGKRYEILRAASPSDLRVSPEVLDTITASSGTGPWLETESTYTGHTPAQDGFFRIRLLSE